MKMNKGNRVAPLVLIAAMCVVHVLLFRNKVNMELPVIERLLFALLAIAGTLAVHEGIHWLFMRLWGLKDVRIEIAKDPLGIPSLRTVASGQLTGFKRITMLLAPFFCLTIIPDVIFCVSEKIELFFFLVAICNAAGSCFDLMDATM